MIKIVEALKLEPHRYTIQLQERITISLKLYNPTTTEHETILDLCGIPTLNKVRLNYQIYEFIYPGLQEVEFLARN
jgi:hypothetical protein